MWQEITIGLAGLIAWVVVLKLAERRTSTRTPLFLGLSVGWLCLYPDLLDLSVEAYFIAILIVSAGMLIEWLVKRGIRKGETPERRPPG